MYTQVYTRVYRQDGSSYVTGSKYFSAKYLEEGETYVKDVKLEDLTGEEIADMLDEDAESANYHHLSGTHRWVYTQMVEIGGEDVATQFMRRLCDKGGFHNF